ncbi:MAG: hypothetical protein ACFCBV_10045 [Phycisphaerales bacterium]
MRRSEWKWWLVVGLVPAAVTMWNASALGAAVEWIQDAEPQAVDEDDEMLQEMMILSIDRESAEYYADLMGFDDLQREIAMELYREYYGQYRDRAFTMRDAYGKIEEAMGGGEADWEKIEAMMADMMRVAVGFFESVLELGDQYIEDLGALAADDAQQGLHARVVRTRTRELAVSMSTMNGSEQGTIDLIDVARRLESPMFPAETGDPAAAALLAYEAEIDAICGPYVTRAIEAFKAMAEAMSDPGDQSSEVQAKLEAELMSMMERFDALNERYIRRVHAALPTERQAEWDLAINRARWPEVYQPSGVHRAYDEVLELEDLTADQREAIDATMALYIREAQTANAAWVEAKLEFVETRRALNENSDMDAWEKYQAAQEVVSEAASERSDLDTRFIERLRTPLTPDQVAKLTETAGGVDVDEVLRQMGGG